MRWSLWSLSLLLALSACVQRDLKRASAAAAGGDWVGAAEWYGRAAAARPGDSQIAADYLRAREEAADYLVSTARAAFSQGRPLEAADDLAYALRLIPAHTEARAARSAFGDALAEKVRAALAQQRTDEASAALQIIERGFAEHPQVWALTDSVLTAWLGEVNALARASRFHAAHGAAVALAARFPAAGAARAAPDEVLATWALSLRRSANQRAREDRLATAWTEAALAAELTQGAEDRALRDLLRREFLDDRALVVSAAWQGPSARVQRIRHALEARVARGGAVRLAPGARGAAVRGELTLAPARCDEQAASLTGEHRYVAGVDEVLNPEWVSLEERAHSLHHRLRQLGEQERDLSAALAAAEEPIARAREALARREAAARDARRVVADVEVEVARAEDARAAALAAQQVVAAGATPTAEQSALVAQLAERIRLLDEARAALEQARALLARAEAALRNESERLRALEAERGRVERELASTRDARQDAREQLDALHAAMDRTSRILLQDRVETYVFEVQEWTRTCSSQMDVRLAAGGREWARDLDGWASVRDRAWMGNPAVGLAEDPKSYTLTDALLTEAADDRVGEELASLLQPVIAAERQRLLAEATRSQGESQLSAYLLAYLLDPERAPEGLLETLRAQHGRYNLAALEIDAPR